MPTLAGFVAFITTVMGIPPAALPSNSPIIPYVYNLAISIVNPNMACVPGTIYCDAVYNFAADRLITIAPDQAGQTYFAAARKSFGIGSGFVAGLVQSTSDESSSESLMIPDALKGLTIGDLARTRTPYGLAYLASAQDFGTLWGVS